MKDLGLAFNPNDTAAGNPKKKGKKVHTCITTPADLHRRVYTGEGDTSPALKKKIVFEEAICPKNAS